MTRVLVTRRIPEAGLRLLRAKRGITLDLYKEDRPIPRKEFLKRIKQADVLLSLLTDKVDAEILAAAPRLKLIANYAVGFDNIDLVSAKKHGVVVTNTPCDEINESVAEHTIALLFALAHRIVETDAYTRAGKYHGWGPELLLGTDIAGKTLGLVGTGRIGTAVARRLHDGFNINILYHDPKRNPDIEHAFGARYVSLRELLKLSDFVSLHVPLLPSTRHLIGVRELSYMKPTSFLLNTARGAVIDEKALVHALVKKEIGGAGLDVYECEPFIGCNARDRKELHRLQNVVLTPHTASATVGAREAMSRVAAENILAFVEGKAPQHVAR
jgi:glyoxylate reductase